MLSNDSDKFETKKQNPFNSSNSSLDFDVFESSKVTIPSSQKRHLNDYDSNILKEEAYKEIEDDTFKLEYKISQIEKLLKSICGQQQLAREIHDYYTVEKLSKEQKTLEEEYESLVKMYKERSISSKITENVTGMFKKFIKKELLIFDRFKSNCSEKLKTGLPKQMLSVLEIKESLKKLENINKSVDELMTLNIPFGENINKYEQLSKYIIKANNLQSEIARHIKK